MRNKLCLFFSICVISDFDIPYIKMVQKYRNGLKNEYNCRQDRNVFQFDIEQRMIYVKQTKIL